MASEKQNNGIFLPGPSRALGRLAYLDDLRALATVFVICAHTVSLAQTFLPPGSTVYRVLDISELAFLPSNQLFIMISGALLLPVTHEKISTFFLKRCSKVALPLVVYYILYVCAKEGLVWLRPDHWYPLFIRILCGEPVEAPHFWLVYAIFRLYLLTPFFRWILRRIPDTVLAGVVFVFFAINTVYLYAPVSWWGWTGHLEPVVNSLAGAFLLGYFLSGSDRVSDGNIGRKASWVYPAENILIAGGALAFFWFSFLILNTETYIRHFHQGEPLVLLSAAAIFLLVRRAEEGRREKNTLPAITVPVRLLSRYSFSILLIHWGVLHYVVKQVLRVDVLSGGIVGGCLLTSALTLAISAAGAVIVEHLLILPLQKLLFKISSRAR